MSVFGPAYAGVYDAMYAEKDYDRECDLLEEAFRRHAGGRVRSVLDLGCGTGSHALRLAGRGYDVTAVDLSSEMLAIAEVKAGGSERVRFFEGDVRTVDAGGTFDAVLLMFAVLGYQRTNEDVRATFANARRHLRPGGLLIFDAWYGPGVLADPPGARARVIETPEGPVVRKATAEMDTRHHLCIVRYRLSHVSDHNSALAQEEAHIVRYFFPMELEQYLAAAGFDLREMSAFGAPDSIPDAHTWNVCVVAEAV